MPGKIRARLQDLAALITLVQFLGSVGGATVLAILIPAFLETFVTLPVSLRFVLGIGVFFVTLALILAMLKAVLERWVSPPSETVSNAEQRREGTQPASASLRDSLQQDSSSSAGSQAWPFASNQELSASYIDGKSLYLSDLTRQNWIVRNRTFENCFIRGPAVVAVMVGTDFINCSFAEGGDQKSLVWPVGPGRADHVGAIGLEGCIFRNCTFLRVGLLVNLTDAEGNPLAV